MFIETTDRFDPARDWPQYMESDPRVREWQSMMESMQQPVREAQPGEWWAQMELVYELGD